MEGLKRWLPGRQAGDNGDVEMAQGLRTAGNVVSFLELLAKLIGVALTILELLS